MRRDQAKPSDRKLVLSFMIACPAEMNGIVEMSATGVIRRVHELNS